MPRREAQGRREAGRPPRHWLLWGAIWVSGGWKLWGAFLCDQGSFSVPRFPYRLCLRSHPPRRSLSAWKPCSATSGSCSILPGQGRLLVQRRSGACFTGLERYPQSSIGHGPGCSSQGSSRPWSWASPACASKPRACGAWQTHSRHPLPSPCDGANVSCATCWPWPRLGPLAQTSSAVHPAQQKEGGEL